jgi:hypothetical protein
MLASPDVVYGELEKYGATLTEHDSFFGGTRSDDMEKALLKRDDRLINLGLAQFGGCAAVIRTLYEQAHIFDEGAPDYDYFLSLRLACLSNSSCRDYFLSFVKKLDVKAIIDREGIEELCVLLLNPVISEEVLAALFRHDGAFTDFAEKDWLYLVGVATENPRIGLNYDTDYGPDMGIWQIHDAIYKFIGVAPVNKRGYWVVDRLLNRVDPREARVCGDTLALINRWRGLSKVMEGERDTSDYDGLTWADRTEELCCRISCLYGWTSNERGKRIPLGSMDSNDLVLRCSYYGNASLTAKDMSKGYDKDNDKFLRAALDNQYCLWSPERRKFIEENGYGALHYYRFRCKQFSNGRLAINPMPVTDVIDDEDEDAKPSLELKAIKNIAKRQDKILGLCVDGFSLLAGWFILQGQALPKEWAFLSWPLAICVVVWLRWILAREFKRKISLI